MSFVHGAAMEDANLMGNRQLAIAVAERSTQQFDELATDHFAVLPLTFDAVFGASQSPEST